MIFLNFCFSENNSNTNEYENIDTKINSLLCKDQNVRSWNM